VTKRGNRSRGPYKAGDEVSFILSGRKEENIRRLRLKVELVGLGRRAEVGDG
jgi:TolB-like protein